MGTTAEHAELIACSKAVEFAQSHAFYPAILEMDALEVKRQLLLTEVPNNASLGRLYEDVQVSMQQQGVWSLSHIGRSGNSVAHTMAAYACSLVHDEFYFASPSFIQAAVIAEFCNR